VGETVGGVREESKKRGKGRRGISKTSSGVESLKGVELVDRGGVKKEGKGRD